MKKKFPTSVTILGRKYKIKQGNNLVYEGNHCLGLCDNLNRIIYIEKQQDENTKKDTLLHEMGHALFFITGFDQKMSDSENEIFAQLITAWFRDVEQIFR